MRAAALLVALALPSLVAAAAAGPRAQTQGERAYLKCYSCHSLEPGRNELEGPTLHGVVGRPIAAEPGFEYSPALGQFSKNNPRWTRELLDQFIADPEALVPRTTMAFTGVGDEQERALLIGYLEGASKKPH